MSARHNVATLRLPSCPRPRLSIGQRVGRYTLTGVLGAGAMGVVYRAYDTMLGREVALKSLHVEDARSRQRFVQEARAMARLSHPNVVQVYDVLCVERPDGLGEQWLIAMELVEGQTLDRWLAIARPWSEIVEVFAAAGRGLAAAHAAGLVHRDFKPANVLVDREGRAKVTDFGLTLTAEEQACTLDESTGELSTRDSVLTCPGTVVGTPAYMAPEQHRGAPLTASTDQFAFCATLFEALFGVRPFDGNTCRELSRQKHLREHQAPRGSQAVPSWLRRVVIRGLHPAPEGRFRDMAALLERLQPRAERGRWLPRAVAALLLVVAGTGLGAAWSPLQSGTTSAAVSAAVSGDGASDEDPGSSAGSLMASDAAVSLVAAVSARAESGDSSRRR